MPDERVRMQHTAPQPLGDPDYIPPAPGPYERFITRAAALPWWAIILGVVAVAAVYSMLTSEAYRRVIQALTDDPQVETDNLFQVVQVVGEPTMVVGQYVGETRDSVQTVVDQLLSRVVRSERVTHTGFLVAEDPASITLRTAAGLVTVPKDEIVQEERSGEGENATITVTYVNRVTITGTLTDRDDDTLTIRTVDEVQQTIDKSRILAREAEAVECPTDQPDCAPVQRVTVERQGEIISGRLETLSNTNLSIQTADGASRELRRSDLDYLYIPTLTVAVNAARANTPILPGDEVRIGFVQDTDISLALQELQNLADVPVPLRYSEGDAQVTLVQYPTLEAMMEATGAGEVGGALYLSDSEHRLDVAQWVEDHPDAGVVLPTPPRECQKDCTVTAKLKDDVVTGVLARETDDALTLTLTPAEYVVIDRDKIVEDRRMVPGACALNNLRGCNAGIFLTLRVTLQAYALALIIGLIFGLLRVQKNPVMYAFSTLYVEVIRGIPLLVILLYAGFVISPWLRDHTPLNLGDEQEAVLGLAFGYGAFIAEIFRAGIQSISRGQMEAARSLGMSYPQAMRFVVLPQAVRVVLPPLGNDFISMLKDSALISVLALPDLLQLGRLYVSRTFRAFEGYNTVAILYLIMTLFLSMVVRIIERRSRLPG